jgi:uncharacterized protein (TIGR02996 family)
MAPSGGTHKVRASGSGATHRLQAWARVRAFLERCTDAQVARSTEGDRRLTLDELTAEIGQDLPFRGWRLDFRLRHPLTGAPVVCPLPSDMLLFAAQEGVSFYLHLSWPYDDFCDDVAHFYDAIVDAMGVRLSPQKFKRDGKRARFERAGFLIAWHDPGAIAAIRAAPDDDAPRLVYADLLAERGDPRGELIALQCRASTPAVEKKIAALLARHPDWARVPHARSAVLRRGFVDEITVDALPDERELDQILAVAPLLRVCATIRLAGEDGRRRLAARGITMRVAP